MDASDFVGTYKGKGHEHVDRNGKVLARFDAATEPESKELTGAIERALAAK